MPRNLELKLQLESFKDTRELIKQNRIGLKEILIQKDIYYQVENGLLKLRIENGKSSLIYYKRDEKSSKRWSDFEYVKFVEGNPEKFFNLIFDKEIAVSKVRELYIHNKTRIHLDKVKGLGTFVELETVVVNGLKDAEKRFNKIINMLKLNTENQIRASYKDLLIRKKNDTYKRKN